MEAAAALRAKAVTGAIPIPDGSLGYTPDSAAWFDMSAISRLGRDCANDLKKKNRRGHAEILMDIFEVARVPPDLPGIPPPDPATRHTVRQRPS